MKCGGKHSLAMLALAAFLVGGVTPAHAGKLDGTRTVFVPRLVTLAPTAVAPTDAVPEGRPCCAKMMKAGMQPTGGKPEGQCPRMKMTGHEGMAMPMAGNAQMDGAQAPSSEVFREAGQRMHHGMNVPYSGNADVDFVRGMIPHHQGAIDMARGELRYGKDKKIRRLARDIVKAQQAEIRMMNKWLEMHDPK